MEQFEPQSLASSAWALAKPGLLLKILYVVYLHMMFTIRIYVVSSSSSYLLSRFAVTATPRKLSPASRPVWPLWEALARRSVEQIWEFDPRGEQRTRREQRGTKVSESEGPMSEHKGVVPGESYCFRDMRERERETCLE